MENHREQSMSQKPKRSVIIDISSDDSSASKSKTTIFAGIAFAVVICGVVLYLKTSDEPPPVVPTKIPSTPPQPTSLPPQSNLATTKPVSSAAAPSVPTEPKALPPEIEIELKRPYNDFAEINQIAQVLIHKSSDAEKISRLRALESQLQNARQQRQSPETIRLLEDTFTEQLVRFAYTEINVPLASQTETIQQNHLDTYAAVQWSAFQTAHKEAQKKLQRSADLEALNALLASEQKLQDFNNAASTLLQSMALQAIQSNDIASAKINYENSLLILPDNQQALAFLHQHAFPAGTTIKGPSGMTFAFLPAGQFQCGSPSDEFSRDSDELLHPVQLSRSIYISTTEITQAQWYAVMGSMPEQFPTQGAGIAPNQPIHSLSWHEAEAFCKRLNQLQPGSNYRLPTEAEWEYACRAGSTTAYNNDQEQLPAKAANTFNPSNPSNHDHAIEVASYAPNAWGLYDMHGNLWEWTSDWKGPYPEDLAIDPAGIPVEQAGETSLRMKSLRGGSYYDDATMARSANRLECAPSIAANYIGLRIVRESTF
jgi:formylglycine-generating enzyme required for sulfatase activity